MIDDEPLEIDSNLNWALFSNSPIPTCFVATDGRFLKANSKWCEFTGYSEEELKTMTFSQITPMADRIGDEMQVSKIIQKRKRDSANYIKRYIRKDGTSMSFHLFFNTINDDEGNVLGFVSFGMPIRGKNILIQKQTKLIYFFIFLFVLRSLLVFLL